MIQQARPDLIVADDQMPRMNGLELAVGVRNDAQMRAIPIVMFTVKRFKMAADKVCRQFDLAALLAKPFNPREFRRLIEQLLEAPPRVPQEVTASPDREASAPAPRQSRARL